MSAISTSYTKEHLSLIHQNSLKSILGSYIVYNRYMDTQCPVCHTVVRPTDYFCFNCGANLHPKPPSTSVENQIMLYLGSFFLPPMGFIWGYKYIKETDQKSKVIGYVSFALTVIAILIAVRSTMAIINSVTSQVNQIQNLQGF